MKRITILADDDAVGAILSALDATKVHELSVAVESPSRRPFTKGHSNKPLDECIMQHFTPSGAFSVETAKTWLAKESWARASTGPVLSRLTTQGYINKTGKGFYVFNKPLTGASNE